ncbi:hypothetical protein, partial [Acetobacter ghanensis]
DTVLHTRTEPDRQASQPVASYCKERAELRSRKQKAENMTPTPETIPTSQENPHQPDRSACMQSALSSLFDILGNLIAEALFSFIGLLYVTLNVASIFLFLNFCALSIFFMGDYIFCNSAHAERFATIAHIVTSNITPLGIICFIIFYWTVSVLKRDRASFDSVVRMTVRKTRPHTAN